MSNQAKELLARIKLNEMLSEKGKKLIWSVYEKHEETSGTVFTWEAQCFPPICYKLQTTI